MMKIYKTIAGYGLSWVVVLLLVDRDDFCRFVNDSIWRVYNDGTNSNIVPADINTSSRLWFWILSSGSNSRSFYNHIFHQYRTMILLGH